MSTVIHHPHDKLFKKSMADPAVAREFFEEHLPLALLEKLNLETLKYEKNTFIDEAYRASEADVVFSVEFDQAPGYLYLLCENQSEIDPLMAFRLLRYLVRLLETHQQQNPEQTLLPVVYPIVIYSGEKRWDAPLEFLDLFGDQKDLMRQIWLKPYPLIDIHRIEDEALREHLLSGLLKYVLKYRQERNLAWFLEILFPWITEIEVGGGSNFCQVVLYYVFNTIEAEEVHIFREKADKYLSESLRGEVMTLAQHLQRIGEERGIQQGEKNLLLRQLKRRFNTMPARYEQYIETADAETLLIWGERLVEAKTIEEIFNP